MGLELCKILNLTPFKIDFKHIFQKTYFFQIFLISIQFEEYKIIYFNFEEIEEEKLRTK